MMFGNHYFGNYASVKNCARVALLDVLKAKGYDDVTVINQRDQPSEGEMHFLIDHVVSQSRLAEDVWEIRYKRMYFRMRLIENEWLIMLKREDDHISFSFEDYVCEE